MQGVCIIILVKNSDIKDKGIFHIDLYGKRKDKFKFLHELQIGKINPTQPFTKEEDVGFVKLEVEEFNRLFRSTKWGAERFIDDLSFFTQMKDTSAMLEYGKFWGMTDIFEVYGCGIESGNDEKFVSFKDDFETKIEDYNQQKVKNIMYRPLDARKCYYDTSLLSRAALERMQHILSKDNIAIVFERGHGILNWQHVFVSRDITDCHLTGSKSYIAPLYLYRTAKTDGLFLNEEEERKLNFKPEFVRMIKKQFGWNITSIPNGDAGEGCKFYTTPEKILSFIYAQMHSKAYRVKYLELLKIDFPRINFDVSLDEFKRLAGIGQELIDAHLMKRIPDLQIGSFVSKIGFENIICQKPTYNPVEQRIYLSTELDKEVYFEGVSPEIWSFKIGGYQVLDKYFKERTGRVLSDDETANISNIIKVLGFNIACNAKIDGKIS
jgi:hypothetical protein